MNKNVVILSKGFVFFGLVAFCFIIGRHVTQVNILKVATKKIEKFGLLSSIMKLIVFEQ